MRHVLVLTLILTNAWLPDCLARDQSVKVNGTTNNYQVPERYIRNGDFRVFSPILGADTAKTVAAEIPVRVNTIPARDTDQNLLMVLFFDKVYSQERVLRGEAERVVADSVRVSDAGDRWRYRRESDPAKDYYFTFDPIDGTPNQTDFVVELQQGGGLSIEGIETRGKITCQMRFVYDGILVQTTAIGTLCEQDSFEALRDIQTATLSSWKE